MCYGQSLPSFWGGVTTGILRKSFDGVMILVLSVAGWTFAVYVAKVSLQLLIISCFLFRSGFHPTKAVIMWLLVLFQKPVLARVLQNRKFWSCEAVSKGTLFLCYACDSMIMVFFCWDLFTLIVDKNNFSLSTSTCRLCYHWDPVTVQLKKKISYFETVCFEIKHLLD